MEQDNFAEIMKKSLEDALAIANGLQGANFSSEDVRTMGNSLFMARTNPRRR